MAEGAWTETDLSDLINTLIERFRPLHDKVRQRRAHLFADPSVDPKLPPPYDTMPVFQSDFLRQTGTKLKARLIENPPVVNTEAPTEGLRAKAQDLETVLNDGIEIVQERENINLMADLADGLLNDAYGVIHWRKAADIWPDLPEENYLDEAPKDGQKKDYYATPETEGEKKGKYREKPASYKKKRTHAVARAGFPWHFEVIDPLSFYFVEDRSLRKGYAIGMTIHEVPLIDYQKQVAGERNANGEVIVSLHQVDNRIAVFTEKDAPEDANAQGGYKTKVKVATVWFRDCFYELVAGNSATVWTIVKYSEHPYEMPPFAIAAAETVNVPDVERRYLPALEGIYRTKPQVDAMVAYLNALAYATAIPRYYLKDLATGMPKLDGNGKTIVVSANSELAAKLPPGTELVKIEFEINDAYVAAVDAAINAMRESAPSTGEAEITATTKPWTANLSQEQAAVSPRLYLTNMQRALKAMVRNMSLVMSKPAEEGGFGEPIATYAKVKDGKKVSRTLVSIAPEDIPSLMVDLKISGTSRSQRMTIEEHGLTLLERKVITLLQYLEDYKGSENPHRDRIELLAEAALNDFVMPGLVQQKLTEAGLKNVSVGPDGTMIGPDGMSVTPEQVLQRNGMPAVPPPPDPAMMAALAGQGGQPMMTQSGVPTTIGNMPPLQGGDGMMPLQGPVG